MKKVLFLFAGLICTSIVMAQAPSFSCYITNETVISPTVYQVDIFLLNTGSIPFEYAGGQWGIAVNPDVAKGGTITATVVPASSSLTNPSQANKTAKLQAISSMLNVSATVPPGAGRGSIISNVYGGCASPGTKIATLRIASSIPFANNSHMNHVFNFTSDAGKTATKIHAYVNDINTEITANGTFFSYNTPGTCAQNISLSKITSIENQSDDLKFIIYPNPATNMTKVLFVDKNPGDYNLSLTNVIGQEVFVKDGKTIEGENSIKIDLSNLAKGVYEATFHKSNFSKTIKLIVE